MASRLDGLMVKEVSGVDRPANRRTFLITKREDDAVTTIEQPQAGALRKAWDVLAGLFGGEPLAKADDDAPKTFVEAYAVAEAERAEYAKTEKLWPIWQALRESATACLLDDTVTDQRAAIATCMQQALDAIAAAGLLDAPAVVKAMAAWDAAAEPILKAADKAAQRREKILGKMKILLDEMMTDASSETPAVKAITKEDDTMADAPGAAVAAVTKADLEALQKSVTDLKTENEKLVKAAGEAADLAKAAQAKQETAEMITKVEQTMAFVPGTTPADLGPVLKRAKDALAAADFDLVEKALVGASAAIKAGDLLKEVGTSGSGAATSAQGQLEGLAKAAQAADPKLTKEQAFVKALDANPALYAQYSAEKAKR